MIHVTCDFCGGAVKEIPGFTSPRPVEFNSKQVDLCENCWWHLHEFIEVKGDIKLMEGPKR